MRTLIASLVLGATALVATAPASAQWRQGYDQRYDDRRFDDRRFDDRDFRGGGNFYQRLDRIAARIDRNFERGSLTGGEARRLRNQLDDIARREQGYRYHGLSRWEAQDLNRRIAVLQQRLQNQRFDDDFRRRGW